MSKEKIAIEFRYSNLKNLDIALLRTAYLIAFSELGYSLILNANYDLIRKQIAQPNISIIPKIPIIRQPFHDDFLGANIIYYPKEARSVLVVFDLKTENKTHRFGVFLPAPDCYGFKCYEYLSKTYKQGIELKFETYFFPQKLDLTNLEDSLHFIKCWQELNT